MDLDTLALGGLALLGLALLLGALTWRAGFGWLPALLLAVPAAIWLPGFFFSPWRQPDQLWSALAGWPLAVAAVAAAWTMRPRLQWFAWDRRNFIASLLLGWLAAALVARGGLRVLWDLPALLASPATDGLDPPVYRAVILALVPVAAGALWMIGVAAGRLLALPVVWVLRRVRGLGFVSTRLKFRHRPGEETVEWHYRPGGWRTAWQRLDVPLRQLSHFLHETRTERVHERTYQSFEARGQFSGERFSGTIEGPGRWVDRTIGTGRSHLRLGALAMTVPTHIAVGANNTLKLLFERYIHALHRADKARDEAAVLAARAERTAEEARARQHAAEAAEAERLRAADEAARHQARVEKSRIDAQANLKAILADAGLAGSDLWSKYAHDLDGRVVSLLAASRAGRGIILAGDGGEAWTGEWRGATARVVDDRLLVQVDDPDWRHRHLSERRFTLGERWTPEERQAWADRITLLATTGG